LGEKVSGGEKRTRQRKARGGRKEEKADSKRFAAERVRKPTGEKKSTEVKGEAPRGKKKTQLGRTADEREKKKRDKAVVLWLSKKGSGETLRGVDVSPGEKGRLDPGRIGHRKSGQKSVNGLKSRWALKKGTHTRRKENSSTRGEKGKGIGRRKCENDRGKNCPSEKSLGGSTA